MNSRITESPLFYNFVVLFLMLLPISVSHTVARANVELDSPVTSLRSDLDYIFESGKDGYTCFRIPSMIQTDTGVLLAFAEGRKGGCSDTGNIDLVLKRSNDGGKTWSKLEVIWNDGENTCGNPAPVVDKASGELFLLSTWNLGSDHEREIINGESKDTRRVFVLSSKNEGKSWSRPKEITEHVKQANWTWYATGPVSGIQLERGQFKGRLVIPCDYVESETKKGGSHVIYSDDQGKTWALGGVVPGYNLNESTVAELSDGRLMLNMRNYGSADRTRKVSVSEDGGVSWTPAFDDEKLIEPVCQGSLVAHALPGDGKNLLVFSNPAERSKRINMTVRFSTDDGSSWPFHIAIHKGPSAYSNLVPLKNGNLGLVFEAGAESPYEGIAFTIIPSDVIAVGVNSSTK